MSPASTGSRPCSRRRHSEIGRRGPPSWRARDALKSTSAWMTINVPASTSRCTPVRRWLSIADHRGPDISVSWRLAGRRPRQTVLSFRYEDLSAGLVGASRISRQCQFSEIPGVLVEGNSRNDLSYPDSARLPANECRQSRPRPERRDPFRPPAIRSRDSRWLGRFVIEGPVRDGTGRAGFARGCLRD